jgi:endonuclease YncB( thermonuclease family)
MVKRANSGIEPGSDEHLPSRRTFLLRFTATTCPEAGEYHGRVEHVSTGKTARFNSTGEILEFTGQILADEKPARFD